MNVTPTSRSSSAEDYVLRYESLLKEGRDLLFPCDSKGLVQMDRLSDRELSNYLFARAVVGLRFTTPRILPSALH